MFLIEKEGTEDEVTTQQKPKSKSPYHRYANKYTTRDLEVPPTTDIKSFKLPSSPVSHQGPVIVQGQGSNHTWIIPDDLKDIPFIPSEQIKLVRYLGSGAFSAVYEAICNGEIVAVKVLQSADAAKALGISEEDAVESFEGEVRATRGLNHPNVIKFVGVSEIQDSQGKYHPVMLVNFCDQGSLKTIMTAIRNQKKRLHEVPVIEFGLDVAEGLEYLHSQGRLHRDIKPANILIHKFRAIIADLGVAQIASLLASKSPKVVEQGIRDNDWKPKEEFTVQDATMSTKEADIYSFGLFLYYLVTGDEPFEGMSQKDHYEKVVKEDWRPEIPAYCPAGLKALITQCWDPDPKKRPIISDVIQQLKKLAKELHPHHSLMLIERASNATVQGYKDKFGKYVDPWLNASSEDVTHFWETRENHFVYNSTLFDVHAEEKESKENQESHSIKTSDILDASTIAGLERVSTCFDNFLKAPGEPVLALLGGAGMGMSMTVHHFAHNLLENYHNTSVAEEVPWLPVFLRFETLSHEVLKGGIQTILSRILSGNEKDDSLKDARLVFILEDYRPDLGNLPAILGLDQFPNFKLMVTCDPASVKDEQTIKLFGMNNRLVVRYLLPFNTQQMLTCANGLSGNDANKKRLASLIKSTPEIRAILRLPSAWNLFVQIFETIPPEELTSLTLGDVYHRFIDHWLKTKGSLLGELEPLLKGECKTLAESFNLFAQKSSFEAFTSSPHSFKSDPWLNLPRLFEENASVQFSKDQSKATERHRIFLSREEFNRIINYRHAQFEEESPYKGRKFKYSFSAYFAAQHIIAAIKTNDQYPDSPASPLTDILSKCNLAENSSANVLGFVLADLRKDTSIKHFEILNKLVLASPKIQGAPKEVQGNPVVKASSNAWTLLVGLHKVFSGQDYNNIKVPFSKWDHGVFDGTLLGGVDATGATGVNAYLRGVNMDQSIVDNFSLRPHPPLKVNSMPIQCFATNNGMIATASGAINKDCGIRICDLETGVLVQSLSGHKDTVLGLAFIPRSEGVNAFMLASVSKDKTLRFWDLTSASSEKYELPLSPQQAVAFSADGKMLAFSHQIDSVDAKENSETCFISIYSLMQKKVIHSWPAHEKRITSLAFVPSSVTDKREAGSYRLASSGEDNKLQMWQLFLDKPLASTENLKGSHQWTQTVPASPKLGFTADYQKVISCVPHGATMFQVDTGRFYKTFISENLDDKTLSVAASSEYVAVGDELNIQIFDNETGVTKCLLTGHSDNIVDLSFTTSGGSLLLLSASGDQTVRFWGPQDFAQTSRQHHTRFATSIHLTDDERELISTSLDGTVRSWDASNAHSILKTKFSEKGITAVHFDKKSKTLLAGDKDGYLYSANLDTQQMTKTKIHTGAITHLNVFSDTNRCFMVSSGQDKVFKFFDFKFKDLTLQGQKTFDFGDEFDPSPIHVSSFSKEGSSLYTVDNDGVGIEWSLEDCTIRRVFGYRHQISTILLSPEGSELLIAYREDCRIQVLKLDNFTTTNSYQGHTSPVQYLNWGARGRYLISGDTQGELFLWSTKDRTPILRHAMAEPVKAALVSSSGDALYVIQHNDLTIYMFKIDYVAGNKLSLQHQIGGRLNVQDMSANGLVGCTPKLATQLNLAGAKGDSLHVSFDLKRYPAHQNYMLNHRLLPPLHAALERDVAPAVGTLVKGKVLPRTEKLVNQFINDKVDLDQASFSDWTPLQLATKNGQWEMVVSLLKAGANPFQTRNDGTTIFHLAADAFYQNEKAMEGVCMATLLGDKNLYSQLMHLNMLDKYGRTPLCVAAWSGNDAVVGLLLPLSQQVVNQKIPTYKDAQQDPELLNSILNGTWVPERFSLANRNPVDTFIGITPLIATIYTDRFSTMALLLADPMTDPNFVVGKKDDTALHIAVRKGSGEAVKQLLAHPKIAANQPNKDGKTALRFAVENRQIAMVKILLSNQSVRLLPSQGKDNYTPLEVAAYYGFTEIVELLLKIANEAEIQKALFFACQSATPKKEIIVLLTSSKANLHLADDEGVTPYSLLVNNLNVNFLHELNASPETAQPLTWQAPGVSGSGVSLPSSAPTSSLADIRP